MVPTLPTGVHTCMREDWNGCTAAHLSCESSNIVKISVLHSMKLYHTLPVVGVHNNLRTIYRAIYRISTIYYARTSPKLFPRGEMAALIMKFRRVVAWHYAEPRNESHFLFSGKTRVLL